MSDSVTSEAGAEAEAAASPGASGEHPIGPISAVVVNYNGEQYLEACVQSLLDQTVAFEEIIVVDNKSTDGSLPVLRQFGRKINVMRLKTNGGPCVARNVGMRAALYRHVLLVDNDVVLEPDVVEKLQGALAARPDAVMAQPRSVFKSDPSRIHYDGGKVHYAGLISLFHFGAEDGRAEIPAVEDIDVGISLCLLADKKAVIDCGAFDESFFILFEDLDLSHRLRLAGHAILKVNTARVLHDDGTAGISFREEDAAYPARRVMLHSRNRWLYMVKCYGLWTLFVSLPGLLVYEAAWMLFSAKEGQLGAWLKGKFAFFRGFREARRKRRGVQKRRKIRDRDLLVGGPLTLSPNLSESKGLAARLLDGTLRAWWGICRWLVF